MTPGARLQAAIGVLDQWSDGVPVEQALTNWGRSARYAGSGDRAAVRDHVYDVLRSRGSCAARGGGESGRALILGQLRMQGVDPVTLFTGSGHAPLPMTPMEEAAGRTPEASADVPAWTLPLLQDRAGRALPDLLDSFRHRAPLYLRVNRRKTSRDAAIARLSEDGIGAIADPRAPTALEVTSGTRRVRSSAAFAEGWIEPQDLSVQIALAAVDWPEGRILDYCAGGGGKALAIADACTAEVLAHDAAPRRMSDLPLRARRAGVQIAVLSSGGLDSAGRFEAVLCDVPCSGSGTWRRDPEAKWRLTPQTLAEVQRVQAAILNQAAPLVVPGGRLVYMTCSLFRGENEAQVEAFLSRNPGWRLDGVGIDTPLSASDGFFHAVLRAPA